MRLNIAFFVVSFAAAAYALPMTDVSRCCIVHPLVPFAYLSYLIDIASFAHSNAYPTWTLTLCLLDLEHER